MEQYLHVLLTGIAGLFIVIALLQALGYLLHTTFMHRGPGHPALFAFHGLFFIVTIIALVSTKGRTIMWVGVFYFLMSLFAERQRTRALNLPNGLAAVLQMWLFALVPFMLFYLFTFRYTNTITLPYMDEVYYGKVASMLLTNGVETNLTKSQWFAELAKLTPYHFFELWFTALLQATITAMPALLTFKLLTVPLLLGIGLFHLQSIARIQGLSYGKSVLSALLYLSIGLSLGFNILHNTPINRAIALPLHYISDFIVLNRTKLSVVLLMTSAAAVLYQEKNRYWYMPIICLAYLWITIVPSMLIFTGVALLFQYRKLWHKAYTFPAVFIALCLLVFWWLYFSPFSEVEIDNAIVVFKYRSVNMILGTIIYVIIAHLIILAPIIAFSIWLFIIKKEPFNATILLLLVPGAVGTLLHSAMVGSIDSYQYVTNAASVLLPLIYFYFFVAFFSRQRNKYEYALLSMVVFLQLYFTYQTLNYSYHNYNETYSIEFVNKTAANNPNDDLKIVTLFYPKGGHFDAPFTNYDGAFYLYHNRKARICQINMELALENLSEKNFELKLLSTSPFLYFCKKYGTGHYATDRVRFIERFKPDYLVVNKNISLSDYRELIPYVKHVATDFVSGTKVYKFHNL